ncbi:rhodanese-like domain-containing protein [Ferroacidibacillus organovorans]
MGTQVVNMTSSDLDRRLKAGEKVVLIDVREPSEVAEGMISGAINIPLGELPDRLKEIDADKEAVIICRSGGRSTRACEILLENGFQHVKNLSGGMLGWSGDVE